MPISTLLYTNFNLPNTFVSLDIFLLGICGGVAIGAVAATLDKVLCQKAIRELLRQGAQTPESAISLRQMQHRGKWYLRFALREGKPLRKLLSAVLPEETPEAPAAPKKQSIADIPFYLPEELRIRAESRYETGRHPIMTLLLSLIALTAGALFLYFIIPELLTMTDNLLGQM